MISFIKGELVQVLEDGIVIETNQIGYEIKVPISAIQELASIGNTVKVYTYLYVREDILCLYGFLRREDLSVFKLLITVNGIGPKGALGILSAMSVDTLRFAILSDDAKTIAKAPGIGAKTASKLILELRDKMKLEDVFESKLTKDGDIFESNGNENKDQINDAISALVALGYSATDAMKTVRSLDIKEGMTTEDILKQSLKKISL